MRLVSCARRIRLSLQFRPQQHSHMQLARSRHARHLVVSQGDARAPARPCRQSWLGSFKVPCRSTSAQHIMVPLGSVVEMRIRTHLGETKALNLPLGPASTCGRTVVSPRVGPCVHRRTSARVKVPEASTSEQMLFPSISVLRNLTAIPHGQLQTWPPAAAARPPRSCDETCSRSSLGRSL